MVIAKRPDSKAAKLAKTNKPEANERAADNFIQKGGSVPTVINGNEIEKPVILRIPESIVARVDQARKDRIKRPAKTPRNTWLYEAVLEKLQREGY